MSMPLISVPAAVAIFANACFEIAVVTRVLDVRARRAELAGFDRARVRGLAAGLVDAPRCGSASRPA